MLDKRKISTVLVGSCLIFSSCIGLLPGLVGKSKKSNFSFLMLLTGGASTSSSIESSTESITPVESDSGANASLADEVTLAVSADAIESDEIITISKLAKPSAQRELVPIQAAYKFGPEGLNFNKPVNLEICYNPQELLSQGLSESTTQIYYLDPDNGELASVGGDVDTNTHCVAANIDHFSTYLVAAQVLIPGNNAPTIGGANFVPANPIAGLPLTVRTVIRDIESNGSGAVASAFLYYRVTGSSTFTKVALLPDSFDTTSERYVAKIPAASVTLSGLQYYIEATDNLGKKRKLPANAPVSFTSRTITNTINPVNPLRFNLTNLSMTAGFSRDLVLQARNTAGTYQNIIADYMSVANGIGIVTKPTSSNLRFTAQIKGVGSLTAISGGFSVSTPITVHAGQLNRIEIFDSLGVLITSDIEIVAGQTYQFDVLGYDAYGNSVLILPAFSVLGGIGSVNANGLFTAGATSPMSGSLKTDMEGFTDSVNVNIVEPRYSIGGVVSGLNGSLLLQKNGNDNLTINNDGSFSFATAQVSGTTYTITILNQPIDQNCSIANSAGVTANSNITNISVSCISKPSMLSYSSPSSQYTVDTPITNNIASILGVGVSYSISPSLPIGLTLDSASGEISGIPQDPQNATNYVVTASNVAGSVNTTISINIGISIPGTKLPAIADISMGFRNPGGLSAVVDVVNSRILVTITRNVNDPNNTGKLFLINCSLNGSSCFNVDVSSATGQGANSGLAPVALIDSLNSKILIVTNRVVNSIWKLSLYRCNLDGTNCSFQDISANQGNRSGISPKPAIDYVNNKLLVVATNWENSFKPSLFRCNLDGTSCTHTDVSAGQGSNSGQTTASAIDTINAKLLIATGGTNKPSLIRCNLDGTGCIHSDISAGLPNGAANSPSIVLDYSTLKVLVVFTNGSNNSKLSLLRCDLDGSNCTHSDISAGQGISSAFSPIASLDPVNSKLLVTTLDYVKYSASLFRCNLDGTGSTYTNLSDSFGSQAYTNGVVSSLDPSRGNLLTVAITNSFLYLIKN